MADEGRTCTCGPNCTVSCSGGCACLRWEEDGFCVSWCEGSVPVTTRELRSDTRLSFCAQDMPVWSIAEVLDPMIPEKIAHSPEVTGRRVSLTLEHITLAELAATLDFGRR